MEPLHVGFPLGIGDCHWLVTKMRALSKYFGGRPIHAHINTSPNHVSVHYLKMCPQITVAIDDKKAPYHVWTEMGGSQYRNHQHWASLKNCLNYRGYDVWGVINPCVDAGMPFDQIWPELNEFGGTEYEYEVAIPQEDRDYVKQFGEKPVLLYPSGVGPNSAFHGGTWTIQNWVRTAQFFNGNGFPVTVVGAATKDDLGYWGPLKKEFDKNKINYVDAVGKTSLPQYCALIESAAIWIGLNSGGGIFSAMRRTPTIMMWCDRAYPIGRPGTQSYAGAKDMSTEMQRNWLNADQLKTYRTFSYGSKMLTPVNVYRVAREVMRV